ncbi:MAG: RDD family protein [Gloeomargarita sp. SKYG116]|nr:RDD family protein [Gloeomargarita sp. SKYG116]MDW8401067.1 RDD family protein [Gloeomargarita sp. SKYGB_i_bin116]
MNVWRTFQIVTPEYTELSFVLAGPGNRLYALVVDYLCLGVALLLEAVLVYAILVSEILQNFADARGNWLGALLWLAAISLLVAFVIYTGYFVWFETLWQGQTPGKKVAHIRVIREDGRPPGLQEATLRALLRPMDEWFLIGAYLVMFGRREKRLGDWVAGTVVIQETPTPQPVTLPPAAMDVGQALSPIAQQLLPDEWVVVRGYVQRCAQLRPQARRELAQALARQLQTRLDVLDDGTDPDVFLHALYWAYQQGSRL